jgi:N-methylhydantoinase A
MKQDGFSDRDIVVEPALDCRYLGQSYEITVPFRPARTPAAAFLAGFHRRHRELYSYEHSHRAVEIVNLRVKAVAVTSKLRLRRAPVRGGGEAPAPLKRQPMTVGRRTVPGAVYLRERLHPGDAVPGPALVTDPESTTYLPPGCAARVDGFLNLIIQKGRRP